NGNIERPSNLYVFYVEYTEGNVKKYKGRIEDFNAVEICYNINPNQPILVSLERIIHHGKFLGHLGHLGQNLFDEKGKRV
ncbi:hypothetical protein BDC45DRAFT_443328, partial [Circinella umbellata]